MTDLNPLFIRACEALWGERWQTAAAKALEMSDRNIRYIVSGERPVKGGMLTDLLRIMIERQAEMDEIIEDLRVWRSKTMNDRKRIPNKLTDEIVVECRQRRFRGETTVALAAEFGVTQEAMSAATNGKTYRHLGGPTSHPRSPQSNDKINSEIAECIRKRIAAGERAATVARQIGVSNGTIHYIVTAKTWQTGHGNH